MGEKDHWISWVWYLNTVLHKGMDDGERVPVRVLRYLSYFGQRLITGNHTPAVPHPTETISI